MGRCTRGTTVTITLMTLALACAAWTPWAAAASAGSAASAAAEDDSGAENATTPEAAAPLATIVVTATRTETRLEETTQAVTVIDRAEIEQRHAETVLEVLRDVPDVDVVQNGSRGTNTELFLRG